MYNVYLCVLHTVFTQARALQRSLPCMHLLYVCILEDADPKLWFHYLCNSHSQAS